MSAAETMDPLDAVTRHLDSTDDHTLLILRVHLLIEERLREIVTRICNAPDQLPAARLTFYQVLCLCRALVGRLEEPAWDFVARLNAVRNRMAHHLDPGDLDELLGSVVDKLQSRAADRLSTPVERFRAAAVYACGYFDALRGSVRLRTAYGPPVTLPRNRARRRR